MKKISDEKIMSLLYTNAGEGMALLMEEYMGLLWSACQTYLNNPEDIRECVQDTLTDFYEYRNRFDINKGTLKAYLYVIAKRKSLQMSKKNGCLTEKFDEQINKDQRDCIETLVVQTALEDALGKLSTQDSQMIRMKYYDGMTCAEIAHEMHLPVETVKKRNQRNLKKLRRILVAILILGLLTACAVTVIYRYRFSPLTGFQQNNEEIWYTMVDAPMKIQTEKGEVIIRSVVWKEETIYAEFEFVNNQLDDSDIHVNLYWENSERILSPIRGQWNRSDNQPIKVKCQYPNQNPSEIVAFQILGQKYEVRMEPLTQFENFNDIGISQTHRGRTIVLRKEMRENEAILNAYTYSDDIWKITWLGGLASGEWSSYNNPNQACFSYTKDNPDEVKAIDIEQVNLTAICEDVKVPLSISDEYTETEIPFFVGEDEYSIKAVWISEGTYEYGVGSSNEDEIIEYGNELMIKVEPVNIEEDTDVVSMMASVGIEEEKVAQIIKPETGETEFRSMGYQFHLISSNDFRHLFIDKNWEPTDIVLMFNFTKDEIIPDELVLRIDQVGKIWNQNYHFELDGE